MDNKNNEIVLFETSDGAIKLSVPVVDETVWLNRNQMADLFGRDVKTIGKHIGNALKEELDNSTVAKIATVQTEGNREVEREIEYYNLDMIISVGYRVKSQRGIEFRRWASSDFITSKKRSVCEFNTQDCAYWNSSTSRCYGAAGT